MGQAFDGDGRQIAEAFGATKREVFDELTRLAPRVGGYYVVYADGYASFSPSKAFEDGYTRI